ncbi:GEVED domain-containing protein, partial [bacterium]|nr:GEVED domain-containing protein [bacterium]
MKENSNFTENGEKNFSHNTLKMCPTIAMIFFHRKVSKKYTKWVSSLSFQFVQNLFISITILSFCLLFSNTAKGQFCGNPASTVELTVTASIQQTSTYSSGKRAFLFSAISGYTYTFSTCSTTTGDTKLRLYSSSTGGTELAVSDNDCGANGKQSEIIWVCPTTGDYSILLTKRNCKNLNFDASVDYYYVSPDPCEGVTLTTNAGTDISLCQGSSLSLAGTSNTTYDQVTFGHCASSGNMDFATSNTFVAFNGETSFSNPTGKTTAYTDYSSSIFAEVVPGQTYADALTLRINSDGNWVIAGKAWIDWNGNNIFEASEAYDLGTTTNSTDGATTLSPLSITVPASAVTGYVKMRVTSRWDSPSTECETGFDGETEDYSILVTSPVSYSWSPTTELNDPLTPQPICSATTNTTYTLTATNSNGCSVSDDLTTTIQE